MFKVNNVNFEQVNVGWEDDMRLFSHHLLVQSQQWKNKNNVWNVFKVTNKITSLYCYFVVYYGVSFGNFEQILYIVLVFLLLIIRSFILPFL